MNSTAFSGKLISQLIDILFHNRTLKYLIKEVRLVRSLLLVSIFSLAVIASSGQKIRSSNYEDSLPAAKVDSLIKAQHSPRKAAIRSAIIPGWGQIYNKKYWKAPIVWGALGVTGYIFVDNLHTYQDLKFAYAAKYKTTLNPPDSSEYDQIKDQYKPIGLESLKAGRDRFRQYVDYSAVFFILFWALNIVDAAVDAHLKAFDISPDLSLKIKPVYNPLIKTGGVSFVVNFKH
jgi:hypothetical protein